MQNNFHLKVSPRNFVFVVYEISLLNLIKNDMTCYVFLREKIIFTFLFSFVFQRRKENHLTDYLLAEYIYVQKSKYVYLNRKIC